MSENAHITVNGTMKLYRRLFEEGRRYWPHIALLLAVDLLAMPLALLTPLPLKIVVDSAIGSHPLPRFISAILPTSVTSSGTALLAAAALLLVTTTLAGLLQRLGTSLLGTYTGEKLVLGFRSRLFSHVQQLSLTYHDSKGATDSTYRIQYDAPAIQWIMVDGIIPLITATLTFAGMIYVTARINWRLALVALAISPVFVVLTRIYSGPLRRRWRDAKNLESSAMSVVQEVLSAVRVVKAFGRERDEHNRFVGQSARGIRARLTAAVGESWYGLLVGLTTAAGTAAVLFIGGQDVRAGQLSGSAGGQHLTLGDLLLVMSYLVQIYEPLKTIGKQLTSQQKALASAERAFALLDEAPAVAERPDARPIGRAAGDVAFDDVGFSYEADQQVLSHVSFRVPPGSRVGVSGRTGAGKTTLVNLLNRFYDPTSGRILLDGVDLRDLRLADLRNQFAIVLQEPVLFSTSIAENIAYARPGAGTADIIEAARVADAHEFIMRLPEGYQTTVGERGMRLSGGERQRISLARAFLRNAPILILDEPTSSVDLRTEAAIMDALERLMEGRTTFIIAHRTSTLANCDLHIDLEKGREVQIQSGRFDRAGQSSEAVSLADRELAARPRV